ncbi:MAG TPA: hypothetical protein VGM90_09505 [Kofleriaceae bacterium]
MKRAVLLLVAAAACSKPSMVVVSLEDITATAPSTWVTSSPEATERLARSARGNDPAADVKVRALGPDGEDIPTLTMVIVRQSAELSASVTARDIIAAEDEEGQTGAKARGFQVETSSTCHDRYCDWNMYLSARGVAMNQVARVWKVDHRIVQVACAAMDKNIFATCQLPMPPDGAELVGEQAAQANGAGDSTTTR